MSEPLTLLVLAASINVAISAGVPRNGNVGLFGFSQWALVNAAVRQMYVFHVFDEQAPADSLHFLANDIRAPIYLVGDNVPSGILAERVITVDEKSNLRGFQCIEELPLHHSGCFVRVYAHAKHALVRQ
jgi:hypothetical protein